MKISMPFEQKICTQERWIDREKGERKRERGRGREFNAFQKG